MSSNHGIRHKAIMRILNMVVKFDVELEQMDVKTFFCYGALKEGAYTWQPIWYDKEEMESHVCKLKNPCMYWSNLPNKGIRHLIISCQKFNSIGVNVWTIFTSNSSHLILLFYYSYM